MLPQLEQFTTEIDPLRDIWKWLDVRTVAFEERELGWLCDNIRVVLTARRPRRATVLPKIDGLLVRHDILPSDRLSEFLGMLGSGDVRLGEDTIHIRQGGPNQFQMVTSYNPRWHERPAAANEFGIDSKTFALQTWASLTIDNERSRRLELLDGRLQNHDPPWDGLPHLRTSFLSVNPNMAARPDLARVDILAPLYLRLGGRTAVRGFRCTLDLECEKTLKSEHIAAALFGFVDGVIRYSRRVKFPRRDGGIRKRVVLPDVFNPVRCVLTYKGVSSETRDLYQDLAKVPGVRWATFRAIVGTPEELEEALSERRGDPLEHTVATLLHLMGLSVVHYGRNSFPRGGDMADLVAFDEKGNVILLVECTARAVDPESEIGKLATRAREIQNRVSDVVVQPVFWTQQSRADLIEPALDVAIREEVAVVTLDELMGLTAVATESPSARRAVEAIAALIPRKSAFS